MTPQRSERGFKKRAEKGGSLIKNRCRSSKKKPRGHKGGKPSLKKKKKGNQVRGGGLDPRWGKKQEPQSRLGGGFVKNTNNKNPKSWKGNQTAKKKKKGRD